MAYGASLAALADPTRRRILDRLRGGPRTVGELARFSRISQPGVSQHLRVLREARLVRSEARGTRRYYRVDPRGLEDLRRYVERFWDGALQAFAASSHARPARELS